MKTGKLLLTILALGGLVQSAQADKVGTNVVFFLVDDLGWRDLGCYGSDYYKTPHIDRLAGEGVRFTDAYAACTVCSPTRAAIMTGKYPARLLLTQWLPSGRWSRTGHKMKEARYISNLPLEEVTIAEALREHGYRTAFMGKWHLGTETYYYPEHQGFDVNIAGHAAGAPSSYLAAKSFLRGGKDTTWQVPGLERYHGTDWFLTEALTDEAIAAAADAARDEQPFFLYLAHYAIHTPLNPDRRFIDAYRPPIDAPSTLIDTHRCPWMLIDAHRQPSMLIDVHRCPSTSHGGSPGGNLVGWNEDSS